MIILPIIIVIIFIIVVWAVDFYCVIEVYGSYIPEKELDIFLSKHLSKDYILNIYDFDILEPDSFCKDIPYIAYTKSLSFRGWYINDFGIISTKSKWHKKLNEFHKELLLKSDNILTKKLSEI
jgi:hypothetical protein